MFPGWTTGDCFMIASYVFLFKSLYLSLSVLSAGHQLLPPPFLNEPQAGPGQFLGHMLLYDQFSALCCVLRGQLSPAVLLMGPHGESCWVPWTLMPPSCVGCLISLRRQLLAFHCSYLTCCPLLLSPDLHLFSPEMPVSSHAHLF